MVWLRVQAHLLYTYVFLLGCNTGVGDAAYYGKAQDAASTASRLGERIFSTCTRLMRKLWACVCKHLSWPVQPFLIIWSVNVNVNRELQKAVIFASLYNQCTDESTMIRRQVKCDKCFGLKISWYKLGKSELACN